jgi:hypothetical protein
MQINSRRSGRNDERADNEIGRVIQPIDDLGKLDNSRTARRSTTMTTPRRSPLPAS